MRISDWSSDVCSSDLARTALKQIVAAAPFEPVRARAAIQRLVGTDPGQRIVEGRAAHRLDTRQPVTRRIAGAGLHRQGKIDLHRRRRARIVRGIEPVAPIRSEEHTSELQSLMRIPYAILLLKK